MQAAIAPKFMQGDVGGGLADGAVALAAQLSQNAAALEK